MHNDMSMPNSTVVTTKSLLFLSLAFLAFSGLSCDKQELEQRSLYTTPEWAKKAVWYQIFPERFHNGDTSNDPQLQDIAGSWPHDLESPYQVSSWTGDWYELQEWEPPDKGFYHNVQRRRYGGDLQGVIDKLDYLQELGINAIYLNPLFESPSLHKYDGATYHHIDNNFRPAPDRDNEIIATEIPDDPHTWKWTTADSLFLSLVAECHNRGMRVIIDGVFNHVGLNFWAFRDVVRNQQESKYREWFIIKQWDDPATEENEFDYQGWMGVRELPELHENENGPAPSAQQYIFDSVRRWMDPNADGDPSDGIDGWRLDVAELVSQDFWRKFREHVRSINPEAYLVGEVWWENWQENEMFNASPWLQGDMFDAVMNYRWTKEIIHFFVDEKNKITATELDARLSRLRDDYRSEVNYVLLNLLDSHDTDRIASQIINKDDAFDHRDSPADNPDYEVRKPTGNERRIQKLIALLQMTYLGAPTIFYGDEAGMWGADDPDCRKPMLWQEFQYEHEQSHPFGKPRPTDRNEFDSRLFDHYKKLIRIRKENPVLQTGDIATLATHDAEDIYVFKRSAADASVIVALNNSDEPRRLNLPVGSITHATRWVDQMSGKRFTVSNGNLKLDLKPKSGLILTHE